MKQSELHHREGAGRHELGLRYSVYLPHGYGQGERRYNTLYLLHGVGDDEYGWPCKGWAQQILDELAWESSIVVMPLGFLNRAELEEKYPPDGAAFESFWREELLPAIASTYRVHEGRAHRAIAGLSMGAEQALDLAWGGRGDYAAVACLSPVLCREPMDLGNLTSEILMRRWPDLAAPPAAESPDLFYLGCAERDHLSIETSRKLAEALAAPLAARGTSFVTELDMLGFHEWSVWRYGLKRFLQLLEKMWKTSQL